MFPRNYFGLYPAFPRENKVFVAMSFDEPFKHRWEQVIAPAIRNVAINDVRLEPHRVDTRRIGDSILTEILGGVSNDLLILADVTTFGYIDERQRHSLAFRLLSFLRLRKSGLQTASLPGKKAIRNGNVMYEIGLAHAVRLPEEVLIFRSDSDHLLFDVANVRVNTYDPDANPEEARRKVAEAIFESIKELDLKRHLAVKAAAQSLDFTSWWVLSQAVTENTIRHFETGTVGQILANGPKNDAIIRLLELGALATDYIKLTPELLKAPETPVEQLLSYKATPFGIAILKYAAIEMFGKSPEVHSLMASMAEKMGGTPPVTE